MSIFQSGCAAILFASALIFAQGETVVSTQDSAVSNEQLVSHEQLVSNERSVSNEQPVPQKTVLYLGGGAYSPWYSLGVLYAVRDYRIPVDSVVGTSWGAFIGALWSQGFELDNIQRLITDSLFVSQLLSKNAAEKPLVNLPISKSGQPSLAFRYAFFGDSDGYAHFRAKDLDPDSAAYSRALFRFQIQEA